MINISLDSPDRVADTHHFEQAPGESVLDAGRRAGFTFPQACRNGNCYRCEGRLLHGDVRHLRSGEPQTANAGITSADAPRVLPCIVTAETDCTLRVDGVFAPGEMPVRTVPAQVAGIDPLVDGISRVRLRLPAGKKIERLAGQYLEIVDGENAYAFSIASAPASGRDIELHVRYGEDNPSSLAVMALLRREPVVTLRLPLGDCTLIAEPRLPLLLIAGATGFSQVKSFIEHAIAQCWTVPISVYWGARSAQDFYLAELPQIWMRENPNIRCVMHVGPIHEAVLADAPDFSNLLVYACGSPPMVYAVLDAFVACGLPAERMFSDVFAWAPRSG